MRKSIQKRKKTPRKYVQLAVIAVCVLALLGISYVVKHRSPASGAANSSHGSSDANQRVTPQDIQGNIDAKQQLAENPSSGNSTSNTTNTSIDLSAHQASDNTVTVIAKLAGYGSGTCKLSVSNGTHSITQQADVIYQPEYSSCAGFSVPVDQLGTGTWDITVSIITDAGTGSKTISLGVK